MSNIENWGKIYWTDLNILHNHEEIGFDWLNSYYVKPYHEKHYFNHSRAGTLEPPGINYAEIGKNTGSGQNGLDLIKLGAFVDISCYSMKHSKQCG